MLAGKNTGASAFEVLALQALPQTSHAWEPRQDMSFLVSGVFRGGLVRGPPPFGRTAMIFLKTNFHA